MEKKTGFLGVDWHTFWSFLFVLGATIVGGSMLYEHILNPDVSLGQFVGELALTLGGAGYLASKTPKLIK